MHQTYGQATNTAVADHLVKLSTKKKFDLKEAHKEFEHQPTRVAVLDALEAGESSCCWI